ncbi:MAG: type II toxin-antitoxin system RelE/ParE family toxin [Alphaproteobacteria bacterium]|nr:type II toxin-antitoxin system RelE/ParE family toxin [Alphaproteobacteria bacterium]
MRVFKTKAFARFARRQSVSDAMLCDAVARTEAGQGDADLGRGVIKMRIGRRGSGKSGGFRTIIIYRRFTVSFFVYGFAKSDQENISRQERDGFRTLAISMLGATARQLDDWLAQGSLTEVVCHG